MQNHVTIESYDVCLRPYAFASSVRAQKFGLNLVRGSSGYHLQLGVDQSLLCSIADPPLFGLHVSPCRLGQGLRVARSRSEGS